MRLRKVSATRRFLPPGADPEYLYTVLGGRLDRNGEWVARIADDGLVFYDQTNPR